MNTVRDGSGEWSAADPDHLRFLLRTPPPRPGSYRRQLRSDLRAPLAWVFLAVGIGLVAAGVWVSHWPWAVGGAAWLASYPAMVYLASRSIRDGRLVRGEVREMRPNPVAGRRARATAVLETGQTVRVTVPTRPAADLVERHGRAELLILSSPVGGNSVYSVVGVRAPSEPLGATGWRSADNR